MSALGAIRNSVVDDIGPTAAHAAEDGLSAGLLAGLAVTFLPLALALGGVLGVHPKGRGPLSIIAQLQTIVREEDARAQEGWFMGSIFVGTVLGLALGAALSVATGQPVLNDAVFALL